MGATGHLGQAIVRHWLKLGCHVTAATRHPDALALANLPVAVARVDDHLSDLPHLAAAHQLIIDAAAPHPAGVGALQPAIDAALTRTTRVLDAARIHGAALAFISSFTTLPRNEPPALAAAAAWRRRVYPYFAAKAAMERLVLETAARHRMPVVVVNPAACLGPWEYRPVHSSLVASVLAGRLPVVIDQPVNIIDVRDVALAIHRAVALEIHGRPIALAGHNTTVAHLVNRIAMLAGRAAPPVATVSPIAASAASLWAEFAFASVGQSPPGALRVVPLIADSFFMQPSPEQTALGLALRPLDQTLAGAIGFHQGEPECGG